MYEIRYATAPLEGFAVYFDGILWESDTFMHLSDAQRFAESTGYLPTKGSL